MNKANSGQFNWKILLTDIRFWIALFFLIRLIGITTAPLETGHNWRQSLTNMIGRNFLEIDSTILYPRIDMAGEKTGIIASEFPLFNYLIYLFSLVFGYSHWYGRLINLIVSSIGIYYFYRLVKETVNTRTAFNGTIILLTSIWFAFSRKTMPDTFSIALVIIGLYHGYSYLTKGNKWTLFYFFLFSTLGMLSKIPALSVFSLVALVFLFKELPKNRIRIFIITAGLCVGVTFAWYFLWVPHLLKTYQFQLFFPKGIMEGIQEILPHMTDFLDKFYFSALHSHIGFACFFVGLILLIRSKDRMLKIALGLVTIVFLLFTVKTGAVFPLHNYYIIPFVPIMALIAGYFLAKIPATYQYILLGLVAIEGIANQQHDFFVKQDQLYRLGLEETVEKTIPKNNLIIINGGPSPQDIYFSHRKGWTVENDQLKRPEFIDSLHDVGATYIILDRSAEDFQLTNRSLVHSDAHYFIYKL